LNKNELNETFEENHRLLEELKDANSEIERIHSTLNQEELKRINRCSQIPGSSTFEPLNSEPVTAYQNNERVIGVWKI